jgi:hypothetical protein
MVSIDFAKRVAAGKVVTLGEGIEFAKVLQEAVPSR